MEKIDRLGWAAGFCIRSYGLRIGIRVNVNDAGVLERVKACLPPGWQECDSPFVDYLYSMRVGKSAGKVRYYHMLHAGLRQAARTMDLDELLQTLENDLALHVAEWAKEHLFVHAGVVGWKGRALMIPGRSLSGKSTLVRALLRAGAEYYSDEYAVLDGAGRVHPYPRKLSLRRQGGEQPSRVSPEDLGARVGLEPLPVGLVALSQFREGQHWRPRRLLPGKALLDVLDNTVPARSRPELALAVLSRLAPAAPAYKGFRGEADETAHMMLSALES